MTRNERLLLTVALASCLGATAAFGASERADKAVVWGAADGNGAVELFWSPTGAWPPGGFRLERVSDGNTQTVADRLLPLDDPEAVKAVPAEQRADLERLAAELAKPGADPKRTSLQAFLRGATVPAIARALGARVTDEGRNGPRSYRLSGLGKRGEVLWRVETEAFDPARVTPAPAAPGDLTATADGGVVRLRWTASRGDKGAPILTVAVERRSGGETRMLTKRPTISGRIKGDTNHGFHDPEPPLGSEATYLVTLHDVFGRPSPPAEVTIRVPDFSALVAPSGLDAKAEPGRIVVGWKPKATAGTTGYVLERSRLERGPFVPVSGEPLAAQATRYVDEDVSAETVYYYRLRSRTKDGTSGEPSSPAWAEALGKAPPAPPQGLAAEVGRTRVRLSWRPVPGALSGYLVERQTASGRWTRLNPEFSTEPRFDDQLGPQEGAALSYRVTTVSHRGKLSAPSAPVAVRLRDTVPPPTPRLLGLRRDATGVRVELQPAAPVEATSALRVLRSEKRNDPGLVLGPALPASARSFQDPSARPGKEYFYRVLAVDESGNRSAVSEPLRIAVARPAPPPATPPQVEARAKPFPHVRVRFAEPPPGQSAVVERRAAGEESFVVIGSLSRAGEGFLDTLPPMGKTVSYRVTYRDVDGTRGAASAPVEISVPGR